MGRCSTHCPPETAVPLFLIGGAVAVAAVWYVVREVITSSLFLSAAIAALSAAILAGAGFVVRELRRSHVPVRAELPRTAAVVRAELVQARMELAAAERRALPAPRTALRGYVITDAEKVAR